MLIINAKFYQLMLKLTSVRRKKQCINLYINLFILFETME